MGRHKDMEPLTNLNGIHMRGRKSGKGPKEIFFEPPKIPVGEAQPVDVDGLLDDMHRGRQQLYPRKNFRR